MKKIISVILAIGAILSSCSFFFNVEVAKAEDPLENSFIVEDELFTWERAIEQKNNYQGSHQRLVEFISANFGEMVQEYNFVNDEELKAYEIEASSIIYIIGENKYATYIDFNSDNGYMIVTPDFELYDFQTKGELTYLKGVEFAFFSASRGFKYYDAQTNSLIDYETEIIRQEDESDFRNEGAFVGAAYAGQDREGDGGIYDPDAYVAERYPHYTFEKSYSISNFDHILQQDTSIYLEYPEDSIDPLSENNCVLNAVYSVLNSWRKRGLCPNLPNTTIQYDPQSREPNHAANLANGWVVNDQNIYSKFADKNIGTKAIDNVPQLYADIRQIVYEKNYGYDVGLGMQTGTNHQRVMYTMSFTLLKYSYDLTIKNVGYDFDLVEYYFEGNGHSQMLIAKNSSRYGTHSMACLGYRKYSYTSGWWIFSSTKTAYLFNVDDGQSFQRYNAGESVWYDPEAYSSSLETFYVYDHLN